MYCSSSKGLYIGMKVIICQIEFVFLHMLNFYNYEKCNKRNHI